MTIAPESLASLDFPTPDVLTDLHREIATLMYPPCKALAIPVEPLEQRLLREYQEQWDLERERQRDLQRISILESCDLWIACCSPSRYARLSYSDPSIYLWRWPYAGRF